MASEILPERTLRKNDIDQFVLRIDIFRDAPFSCENIMRKMTGLFDRLEKRSVQKYQVNFTQSKVDADSEESHDYVLVSDGGLSLTFSEHQDAFIFTASSYVDNSTYKSCLKALVSTIADEGLQISAKRIGMRFINNFKCSDQNKIGTVFGTRLAAIVRAMLKNNTPVRVIGVEEFRCDDDSARIQYGILNRFYPASITVYDLLFDIDAYVSENTNLDEWESTISRLNHLAYKIFFEEMNQKFVEGLK